MRQLIGFWFVLILAFGIAGCGGGAGSAGSNNTAPTAFDQTLTITSQQPFNITLSGRDAEGSPLRYVVTTQPSVGTLGGTAPNLTYTASQSGTVSFQFIANDGLLDSAPATVTLNVTLPPPPVTVGRASATGPLGGATISLYEVPNFDTPTFTTQTTVGSTLAQAGYFTIPNSAIHAGATYLMVASGGLDFDVNNDGVIDSAPTANNGRFHSVASANQLLGGGANINILTEVAYHRASYMLAADSPTSEILTELDQRARYILSADVNGDSRIDGADLAAWDARTNPSAVQPSITPFIDLAATIRAGQFKLADALQLSDPIVASLDVPGATTLETTGNTAYVMGTAAPGLQVFDISDHRHPVLTGNATVGSVLNSDLEGSSLFLLLGDPQSGASQLAYVDLTNPSTPRLVGSAPISTSNFLANTNHPVAQRGNFLYAPYNQQLAVFQLTSNSITEALPGGAAQSSYQLSGNIAITGNYALLGTASGDIAVWDISDGTHPLELGSFKTNITSNIEDILVFGSRLFVSGDDSLVELNLFPQLTFFPSSLPSFLANYPNYSGRLTLVPNGLVVGQTQIDVTVATQASTVRQLQLAVAQPNFILRPAGVDFIGVQPVQQDANAYTVRQSSSRFVAIDGSVRLNSKYLQLAPATGYIFDFAYANGAVLASTDRSVDSFQVINGAVVRVASATLLGPQFSSLGRLDAEGNFAYWVSPVSRSLAIVDETNPASPSVFPNQLALPCFARDVSVENGYAYIPCGSEIDVVSVASPATPQLVTRLPRNVTSSYLLAQNNLLFAPGSNGLDIFNISNPGSPVLASHLPLLNPAQNDFAFEVRTQGNLAYISVSGQGLYVVDISQTTAPVLLSVLPIRIGASRFVIAGNLGYAFNGGLNVVDISNPAAPKWLYSIEDELASDAVVIGNRVVTRSGPNVGLVRAVAHILP